MVYLIDTHASIWAISEKEKLSALVLSILEDKNNRIIVSHISLFEIAIKLKIGKLTEFKSSLSEFIEAIYNTQFELLPLKEEHFITYSKLHFSDQHKDPFDRLLAAVAVFENATFITKDEKLKLFKPDLRTVW